MDLKQLEPLGSELAHRVGDLLGAGDAAMRPDLGGEPDFRAHLELGKQVAEHFLGPAVHGRGIDHCASGLGEEPQHLAERLPLGGIAAYVERIRRAHADDGHGLLRSGECGALTMRALSADHAACGRCPATATGCDETHDFPARIALVVHR